ncbi:syntaxin-binding protein 5 [Paragonimus westermani]|uniref:Syntaxin-binding protein 5 n=1 Tax=Paragonimus westermani TaxID=34504 RepID=A0A5J4NZL0_9TREM|nr:syntaxin-binding protein 5 [Paragonimus westermani]
MPHLTHQTSLAGTPDPNVTNVPPDMDKQLVVLCSEKQACVLALPSQTCLFKAKITETSHVVRASIQRLRSTSFGDSVGSTTFLACYLANGHFIAFSLPGLRLLMDVDYLPYTESVSRSFAFGQHGQAIYLTTPSELLKITWSSDVCANLNEMRGDLFLPCNMPEPPKRSFFKNLLTGTLPTSFDRDELFGEDTAGKGMSGVSTLLPNTRMDKLSGQTGAATSEISRARNAAIERGEKLQHLDLQTQEMMDQAKGFSRSAAMLAAKYEKKDKRRGRLQ